MILHYYGKGVKGTLGPDTVEGITLASTCVLVIINEMKGPSKKDMVNPKWMEIDASE